MAETYAEHLALVRSEVEQGGVLDMQCPGEAAALRAVLARHDRMAAALTLIESRDYVETIKKIAREALK